MDIVGYIHIPPGVVVVYTVPSVLGCGFVRSSVYNIARGILATTEGSEEIGEIIADTFAGSQCVTNIEILDEGVIIIIVLEVMNDPTIDRLYLFGIGVTVCTNFVSEFFCLRIPQGCSAIGEIRSFQFADEIVCE